MAFESMEISDMNVSLCKTHSTEPIHIGNMEITCGKLSLIRDISYKFDLILNCSGIEFNSHKNDISPLITAYSDSIILPPKYNMAHTNANGVPTIPYINMFPSVITLPWGDFQAPPVKLLFWDAFLYKFREENVHSIAICCSGGHGRTGTALAAIKMAYEASVNNHITDTQAINWVRDNYCIQAIETRGQFEYLSDLKKFLMEGQMIENIEK